MRAFLTGFIVAVSLFHSLLNAAAEQPRPNIILLISDDHRWDAIGVAGNPHVKTPHLDQMARQGLYFRDATIHVSSCSPSRATLLTGLPPHAHRWYSNEQQWKEVIHPDGFARYALLPQELKEGGYHTAFAGKWHLTPDPWNCGFEEVGRWMLGGAGPFKNPRLAEGKSRQENVVNGFTQTIFADEAIEMIQEHSEKRTSQPLFLWTAFTAPHGPFVPNPEPFAGMYTTATEEALAPPTFADDPKKTKTKNQSWPIYYEAISALDLEVGRIMEAVKRSSLSTNTLVVFIGDNGFMMGSRGMRGKYVPYEEGIRVPMIVWGPKHIVSTVGKTTRAAASSLDLPVTFAAMGGIKVPGEWAGRDLSAVLKDGEPHGITWAVSEYPDYNSKIPGADAYRMIRTTASKLVKYHPVENRQDEFFDLVADPHEKNNLFGKPDVAAEEARLARLLQIWRTKTGDITWDMQLPLADFEAPIDAANKERQRRARRAKRKAGQEAQGATTTPSLPTMP